jgi:hypothetical protein
MNDQAPLVLQNFFFSFLPLVEIHQKVKMASVVLSFLEFNIIGVIPLKLAINKIVETNVNNQNLYAICFSGNGGRNACWYFLRS